MSGAAPLLTSPCPSFVTTGRRLVFVRPPSSPRLLHRKAPPPRPSSHARLRCSSAAGEATSGGAEENPPLPDPSNSKDATEKGFWSKWKMDTGEMSSKLAKLGLAAVLAYGLFDGVTYTTFFVLAFLGYEKSTGNNPAANIQALLGIVILMWTGNNVTRPFRVAGAAALAPTVDKGLKKIQKYFNFPRQIYAFALVVGVMAMICLSIIGLLILSRWPK